MYSLQGGHSNYVVTLLPIVNNLLVSGSVDNSVNISDDAELIKYKFTNQTNALESIVLLNDFQLASASMEYTINLWN
jgi:WD40 repeat protein